MWMLLDVFVCACACVCACVCVPMCEQVCIRVCVLVYACDGSLDALDTAVWMSPAENV